MNLIECGKVGKCRIQNVDKKKNNVDIEKRRQSRL